MKKSTNKLPEHHNNIDAPIYVWRKVHETGDLSWLLVKRKKLTNQLLLALQTVWESIYNEYVKEFGYSELFTEIKEKEIEIARYQARIIISKDDSLFTEIAIAQEELKDLKTQVVGSSFMKAKMSIETRRKFQLNEHTTSIREFYSWIKFAE